MAFATVSSEPASQLLYPVHLQANPKRHALSLAPSALDTEACPVVHLIHPDEIAATRMARSWTWLGARTRIHSNAAAFAQSEPSDVPGCVIVHVRLAWKESQDATPDYPVPNTRLPMIVTADRADVRTAVLAMKAGAVDFFEAPLCDRDLSEAVEKAIQDDRARREFEARRDTLVARFATLTRREREVMSLVTRGLLNKQVAGDLGLSEVTVKVHRGSAMRKMGARTIADLVRMADAVAACSEPAT